MLGHLWAVLGAPGAEVDENWDERKPFLRQLVILLPTIDRRAPLGENTLCNERGESVGENARGDPFLACQELAEGVFAVEDDVAHDEQGPRIAYDLQRHVDRATRVSMMACHLTNRTPNRLSFASDLRSVRDVIRFLVMYDQPTDTAAFDQHYFDVHLPLAKRLPGLRRYAVSRNPVVVRGEGPYYLVAELDWDDMDTLRKDFASPLGQQTARDVDELAQLCPGIRSVILDLEDV